MTPSFRSLVGLFWKQLIRRKSLWILVAIGGVMLLISLFVRRQMMALLVEGVRYDVATRRATEALDQYAAQVRQAGALAALIVGALVAPGSRRDGTTQFVLTLGVSRMRLALAQFGALALFVSASALVIHSGYIATAWSIGALNVTEALVAWLPFVAWLLLLAATSFALSLTRPALLVYAVLLALPGLLVPLLAAFAGQSKQTWSVTYRLFAARLVDNLPLLFPYPSADMMVAWPHLRIATPERPPFAAVELEAIHVLAAAGIWLVLGVWAYQRHDFGSRLPTK